MKRRKPKLDRFPSRRLRVSILTEVWVRLEVDPVSSLGWPRPGRTLRRTHDQQQPIGAGECAPPGCAPWPEDRVAVILTPDQRVRVFISSTLEELAAARREIRRLHRFRCGMSPEPAPRAAQHVPGLPGAESDLCGDLLAAVWLDRAGGWRSRARSRSPVSRVPWVTRTTGRSPSRSFHQAGYLWSLVGPGNTGESGTGSSRMDSP